MIMKNVAAGASRRWLWTTGFLGACVLFSSCLDESFPDEINAGPVRPCAEPLPDVIWQEVGASMGLSGNPDPAAIHHHGGGLAVVDIDGDDDLDVILSFPGQPPVLYWREGDSFVPESLPAPEEAFHVGVADLDGDGDPDLAIAGYKMAPTILLNEPGGFVERPLDVPDGSGIRVREMAPGDIDGDGVPDIYAMANVGSPDDAERADFLLRGQGDGTFVLDPDAIDVSLGGRRGFDVQWFDWDADGDLDVYVANDDGGDFGGNILLENTGGDFVDATPACSCGQVHLGMGVDVGDHNGDQIPDLYLTAVAHNVLFQGLPDGSFFDAADSLGADPLTEQHQMGWGAVWLDYDNDGRLDILNAQGDRWQSANSDVGIVYEASIDLLRQDASGEFVEIGAALGLAQSGSHRSVVAVDHNQDGILDPLVTDVVGTPRFYLSEGCTSAGWLGVKAPHGSRVEVTAGGRTQVAWASPESSYAAARPSGVHFGLGRSLEVERLRVFLPDGRTVEAERFAARRVLKLE
jgi:hypothetical protein